MGVRSPKISALVVSPSAPRPTPRPPAAPQFPPRRARQVSHHLDNSFQPRFSVIVVNRGFPTSQKPRRVPRKKGPRRRVIRGWAPASWPAQSVAGWNTGGLRDVEGRGPGEGGRSGAGGREGESCPRRREKQLGRGEGVLAVVRPDGLKEARGSDRESPVRRTLKGLLCTQRWRVNTRPRFLLAPWASGTAGSTPPSKPAGAALPALSPGSRSSKPRAEPQVSLRE